MDGVYFTGVPTQSRDPGGQLAPYVDGMLETFCTTAYEVGGSFLQQAVPYSVGAVLGGLLVFVGGAVYLRKDRMLSGLSVLHASNASKPFLAIQIAGQSFTADARRLERGVTIGRGDAAGLRVEASGLSREHALLQLRDRRLYIEDLGSTNGTTVDGQALRKNRPVPIDTGNVVRLGLSELLITRE